MTRLACSRRRYQVVSRLAQCSGLTFEELHIMPPRPPLQYLNGLSSPLGPDIQAFILDERVARLPGIGLED